jgi:HSP20 family molecular chaperone IbpA
MTSLSTLNLLDAIEQAFHGQLEYLASAKAFLPYNIYQDEKTKSYVLEMAVAGYNKDDLSVEYTDGRLTVEAKPSSAYDNSVRFIHQGMTKKAFKSVFPISPVFLVDQVSLKDGLLKITFARNPEKVTKLEIK